MKNRNDIELNIMLAIVIVIIIIFAITMVIAIIKGNKSDTQETNIANPINSADIGQEQNSNNELDNNNVLQNNTNTISNTSSENTNTESNSNEQNTNQTSTETTNTQKTYSTSETIPFRVEGGKVADGDINKGLTIEDSNGNQWIWIEVPKSITQNASTDAEIESSLEQYVKTDSSGNSFIASRNGCKDINHPGTGLTDEKYNQLKSKMLQSIKSHGGFYIGKYETGYEAATKNNVRTGNNNNAEYQINEKPVIKFRTCPYNWINCRQAETLAESLSTGGKTTSLMFGIQWDLVLKYLNIKLHVNPSLILTDSSSWGNYKNDGKGLLKTGRSGHKVPLGINDLAGNVWEYTLEYTSISSNPCTVRGGDYMDAGMDTPVYYRGSVGLSTADSSIGFRCAMY